MKLSGKEKISYGLGAVGKDMVYMLSASYILYYYQDILGVSAIAMGIILMAARVFDAFNDPVMGVVVAKTRTRWGKFRPWLLIGTITNAIVLYIMFAARHIHHDGYPFLVHDSGIYGGRGGKRRVNHPCPFLCRRGLGNYYYYYHEMCLCVGAGE